MYGILLLLYKQKSTYTKMFKQTKVSHITLQRALRQLQEQHLINKYDIGHKKVDYDISEKGIKVLFNLQELRKYLQWSLKIMLVIKALEGIRTPDLRLFQ